MKTAQSVRVQYVRRRPSTPYPHGWQNKTLRAWLLAVLRFAITLEEIDRISCIAAATELDKSGSCGLKQPDFVFFRRSTHRLCGAIFDPQSRANVAILYEHIARIEDDRSLRAFAGAVKLQIKAKAPGSRRPGDLWKGL